MATSPCPICFRHVRQENLPLHVEACLTKADNEETDTSSSQTLRVGTPPPRVSGSFLAKRQPPTPTSSSSDRRHSLSPGSLPTPTMTAGAAAAAKKRRIEQSKPQTNVPLAERMRPSALDEFVGQEELVGPGKLLASLIQADRIPNMILWGPPGCGKTTLAHVIARRTGSKFITLSGATSKAGDMQEAIDKARGEKKMFRRHTIVFVDEIHRFKKNQQDFFLPPVEDGTITLIGATTENPSFEINNALLSRCRVYTLTKHSKESVVRILQRALAALPRMDVLLLEDQAPSSQPDENNDTKPALMKIEAEPSAIEYMANQCGGDARVAINYLEIAVQTAKRDSDRVVRLTEEHVKACFAQRQTLYYDRNADFHYDLISAFHKSVRGSDANATLYWLGRMLEGGENPLYIARRMIRIASEDIGLAAPELLPQAVAAYQAAHFVGMPECDVMLAQCATQLARAPKSIEVYAAYKRVKASIQDWNDGPMPDVPMHLRNAPTRLMKEVGYGSGYMYNPDYTEEETRHQTYLPTEMLGTDFFNAKNGERHGECD